VQGCGHVCHSRCNFAWMVEVEEHWGADTVGQCQGCTKTREWYRGSKWTKEHLSVAMDYCADVCVRATQGGRKRESCIYDECPREGERNRRPRKHKLDRYGMMRFP
jgi:hypothetical protein